MNEYTLTLENFTNALLADTQNLKEIVDSLHKLHHMYSSLSGISAGSITDEDIYLPSGKAVSPIKAAHCLMEIHRTIAFIRGINKAILALQTKFSKQRIHILYAGCGPYATLLTPLVTRFTADEIAFHMLEINEISLEAAKNLYTSLQLESYIEEWIHADAAEYKIQGKTTIHLVISETMLNALIKEPQVAIMLNLMPQINPNGLFIPQEIKVSAQLLSPRKEDERYLEPDKEPLRINLGNIYTIGRYNCLPHQPVTIKIPEDTAGNKELYLITDINTFDNERLGIYQSSLNMPLRIARIEGFEGKSLKFTYQMGEKPAFMHEWC